MESPSLEAVPTTPANPSDLSVTPRVRAFEPGLAEAWDRFVHDQPRASFFHLIGWKRVIEKTFGYDPCYLYTERNGKITGIAPLFFVSNWILRRCLISVPLGVYGGVCATDEESEQALLSHLRELATARQVDYLELRNRNGGLLAGFHSNTRYVTFTTTLAADPAANLRRLPKDTRYMIRKGEKAGLRVQRGLDQLDVFYPLFATSMRRHGTPVFPRSLFANLTEEFPDRTDLLMIYAGSKPVTGVFSFFFRDAILPYYAGADARAPQLAANNFMYWELMKSAAQAGIRTFDFGRSKKGTGSFAFKAQWNMTIEPLDYQVFLVKRKTVPNFSPVNPKFELATQIWQRLPLWLTTKIGPRVVRWFP